MSSDFRYEQIESRNVTMLILPLDVQEKPCANGRSYREDNWLTIPVLHPSTMKETIWTSNLYLRMMSFVATEGSTKRWQANSHQVEVPLKKHQPLKRKSHGNYHKIQS